MRKILLSLTTALALGALAVPTVASAASHSFGGSGGAPMGGSRGNAGFTARSFSGANVNANVGGTRNFAVNNSVGVRNSAVTNNSAQRWNGQRWARDGRHHRHHDRDFLFVPFAAFGAYAAYDQCWQTEWTPVGYQQVYVCGPDGYNYY